MKKKKHFLLSSMLKKLVLLNIYIILTLYSQVQQFLFYITHWSNRLWRDKKLLWQAPKSGWSDGFRN